LFVAGAILTALILRGGRLQDDGPPAKPSATHLASIDRSANMVRCDVPDVTVRGDL
jgi:hypothetical protein